MAAVRVAQKLLELGVLLCIICRRRLGERANGIGDGTVTLHIIVNAAEGKAQWHHAARCGVRVRVVLVQRWCAADFDQAPAAQKWP